jgi:hypothetical protein
MPSLERAAVLAGPLAQGTLVYHVGRSAELIRYLRQRHSADPKLTGVVEGSAGGVEREVDVGHGCLPFARIGSVVEGQ